MILEILRGNDGTISAYIDDYRIAGEKPLGGGTVIYSWKIKQRDIPCIAALEASNQRLREALKELLEREWQDDEGDPRLEKAREQAKKALEQK